MRTGILTYHNGINHGGFLQAYALQNFLRSKNIETEVIHYKNWKYTIGELKYFLNPRKPQNLFSNALKILKFRREILQLKLGKRIYDPKELRNDHFDNIIIGSDSIWNYTNSFSGFDPTYFSKDLNADNIISYAASFGPDKLDSAYPKEIQDLLRNLNAIAVRDDNSFNCVEKLIETQPTKVLDPTFLYDFHGEQKPCRTNNFILAYAIDLPEGTINSVKRLAKQKNKKIVSIGYKHDWADVNVRSLSPFEWLGYFANAHAIITSMFHGTIFCVKYNKPFCTVVTPYRANKLRSLLKDLQLESRLALTGDDVEAILNTDIDYTKTQVSLDSKRKHSEQFLLSHLIQ